MLRSGKILIIKIYYSLQYPARRRVGGVCGSPWNSHV